MATGGIGQLLIERYAKVRAERLFSADGEEYVLLHDSTRGHFPVHMRARGSSPDTVTLRAHWSAGCAHVGHTRLHECVNRFNDRNTLLTASVRESHDLPALEVVGSSRFWVRDEDDFGPFVRFVDRSLASAVRLFDGVYAETQLRTAAEPERRLQIPA